MTYEQFKEFLSNLTSNKIDRKQYSLSITHNS